MNPTQVNPTFAESLGWDVQQMNNSEKVTVVRRRVVYEELVVTKKEFEKLNNKIQGVNLEPDEDDDFFINHLEMKDIGFLDFTEEETSYIAFPGDVTSFTDDAISFLFQDKTWTNAYEPIKVAS